MIDILGCLEIIVCLNGCKLLLDLFEILIFFCYKWLVMNMIIIICIDNRVFSCKYMCSKVI